MKKILTILATVGLTATATINVVACNNDNSKKNEDKITIDVNKRGSLEDGQKLELSIKNFKDLTNTAALSEDDKIATTKIIGENVVIYGVTKGSVKIRVKAENANDATIDVQVNSTPINVNLTSTQLKKGDPGVLTITNFSALKKVLQNFKIILNDGSQPGIIEFNEIIEAPIGDVAVASFNAKEVGTIIFHVEAEIKIVPESKNKELKKRISKNLTITVEKQDVKDISQVGDEYPYLDVPKEGMTKKLAEELILQYIRYATGAFLTTAKDFTTNANENVKIGDKIKVIAIQESENITGQFEITAIAERTDISNIVISDVKIGDSKESVEEKIQNAIKEISSDVTIDDYTIYLLDDQVTRNITVMANETSVLIQGYFEIKVNK